MTRSVVETRYFGTNIQYYAVIDTMFNTLVIYTSSAKAAQYVAKKVDLCKHDVPYDYMKHDHTIQPNLD